MTKKKRGGGFLKKVNNFLKKTKILSSAAKLLPIGGNLLSGAIKVTGYGKKGIGGFKRKKMKYRKVSYHKEPDIFMKRNVNYAF